MKPETERILKLADAYADAEDHRWEHPRWGLERCDIETAIERIIAERDAARTRVAELEAERDVLVKGVLAAREGMEKGWTDEAVMDAFHAALKLAKGDKP